MSVYELLEIINNLLEAVDVYNSEIEQYVKEHRLHFNVIAG